MAQGHPLIFGEVLFDCFPDGSEVPGGAPFNVAWNLQAFGQQPLFISRIGRDSQGEQIKRLMSSWSMSTDHLQLDPARPTGRVEISLSDGEPSFSILPDQAYDAISPDMGEVAGEALFLYHGSLALREEVNQKTLAAIHKKYPCPVFLDVNLREPWWSRSAVLDKIKGATWLKLNNEECYALFPDHTDLDRCAAMLLDRFDLKTVFLTMGSKGAKAFSRDSRPLAVKPSGSVSVVDTVGAGDAFSSVLLLGIIYAWPLQLTLDRAQEFASAVVSQRGAISQDRTMYESILNRWLQE